MLEQNKFKITLIQLHKIFGSSEKNEYMMLKLVMKALKQPKKPDVIVLPEMWTTRWMKNHEDPLDKLRTIARRSKVNIVAGSVADERILEDSEAEKTTLYNTAYIIDREGEIVTRYDQVNVPGGNAQFSAGGNTVTFELDGIPCGIVLGYDLRFPEFMRKLTFQGAKLIFVPGMWVSPIKMHWKLLNIVRAIENKVFIAAANHVGKTNNLSFPGMSMVVNPWGEVQLEGDERPDALTTIIDISLVDQARDKLMMFHDYPIE